MPLIREIRSFVNQAVGFHDGYFCITSAWEALLHEGEELYWEVCMTAALNEYGT
jgi:hypothetical protein